MRPFRKAGLAVHAEVIVILIEAASGDPYRGSNGRAGDKRGRCWRGGKAIETGMGKEFSFASGAFDLAAIARLNVEIWADLAFDDAAKAALKRDGLTVDGLRLTGPNPFTIRCIAGDGTDAAIAVSAGEGPHADALLDLWRIYFLRRIRERATA